MDIKDVENQLNKADSLLTTFSKIVKKHWGILTLILIGVVIFWFCRLVLKEIENPTEDSQDQIEEYEEYDEYLDEEL